VRTYLTCPFAEKDEAKALGARWDAARKRWYIENVPDLAPFSRWLADGGAGAGAAPAAKPSSAAGVRTGPAQVVHCGCAVLPWEPCVHTPAAA
jgi:hypothetical protein